MRPAEEHVAAEPVLQAVDQKPVWRRRHCFALSRRRSAGTVNSTDTFLQAFGAWAVFITDAARCVQELKHIPCTIYNFISWERVLEMTPTLNGSVFFLLSSAHTVAELCNIIAVGFCYRCRTHSLIGLIFYCLRQTLLSWHDLISPKNNASRTTLRRSACKSKAIITILTR